MKKDGVVQNHVPKTDCNLTRAAEKERVDPGKVRSKFPKKEEKQ